MTNIVKCPLNDFQHSQIAIVCDNGSYSLKAGFSNENFPRAIIPTIVGRPKNKKIISNPEHEENIVFSGESAIRNKDILDTICPIRKSIICDWDAMEQIWYHMYYEELLVPPENYNILHTEVDMNSKPLREKMFETMFELFNVPKTAVIPKSVLALYSSGRTTGLMVDSGNDYTQVIPIFDGYPSHHAVQTMSVGGWHITQYLMELLNQRGYSFDSSKDFEILNDIKEKLCYFALNFKFEKDMYTKEKEKEYTLPDGMVINVESEAFQSTEILFDPLLFNIESKLGGIHNLIYRSCSAYDYKGQKTMFNNIILAGGNTMFPFLPIRLEEMVAKLVASTIKVQIKADPGRKYSTWLGGAVLASMPSYQQMWISKEMYEEKGAAALHDCKSLI
ncbi:actin-like [Melanaphis sacchari]|uniref:actin-like n=1 Tax=Melanaphis sacchari TaxID=742174 RepID=UPI000DC147E7|nr:actin-like [Melanaphis sacchari]